MEQDFKYELIGLLIRNWEEALALLPPKVVQGGPGVIDPDPQAPKDDKMQMRSMPRMSKMSPNNMPSFMIGGRSLNQGLYK